MLNNKNKVIIVGLDGATFTSLKPLVDDGRMPNLKQILENGVSGILNSTIPPFTAPAWSSFATGKNPGKHGVYDFVLRDKNNNDVIVNSKIIKGEKVWEILGDRGKKVGVINFPISYPPERVNGFMISGFISPLNAKNYSYPSELYPQILKEIGDYIVNVRIPERRTEKEIKHFIDKLLRETELKYKTFEYLSKRKEWDFLYVLFMIFDKVQHILWKYLDIDELDYPMGEVYKYTIKCYQLIDDILGDLLHKIDDNISLIIISDHGFCSNKKRFYINLWLAENGFLSINFKKLIREKIKDKLGFKSEKFFEGLPIKVTKVSHFINFNKTKAYFNSSSSYGIFINLKNRDQHGIVEGGDDYNRTRNELRSKLLSVKDKENGKNVFENVYFPEEIYHGPFLKNAPDLILSPADGYELTNSLFSLSGEKLLKVTAPMGIHHQKGIFIALNKKIIKYGATIEDINIVDIAPTVLYLMGLPVPSDMDGKVIVQMFEDSFLEANPIEFSDSYPKKTEALEGKIYTEDEERQIRNSLKELGYLD